MSETLRRMDKNSGELQFALPRYLVAIIHAGWRAIRSYATKPK